MKSNLLAKDIMCSNPLVLTEEQSVVSALDLFNEHNTQVAPVVNKAGKIVGIFSVHDALVELWCQDFHPNNEQKVAELMKRSVVTVDANKSVLNIVELLCIDKAQLYPISTMGITTINKAMALSVEERAKTMKVNTPKMLPVVMNGLLAGVITRIEVIKALRSVYGEQACQPATTSEYQLA